MIKKGQLIEVGISGKNKSWYVSLGYEVKAEDHILVPPEHLPENCEKKIVAICDRNGEEVIINYRAYCRNIKRNNGEFICRDCFRKDKEKQKSIAQKAMNTNQKKYGTAHPAQLDFFKEKSKNTNKKKYNTEYASQSERAKVNRKKHFLEKYGVESSLQVKEVREKAKKTIKKKYGVDNVAQNKDIKAKTKKTNKEKYGVECTLLAPEVQKKTKNTLIEKYGVEHIWESEEIREKQRKTLSKNGTVFTSSQQVAVFNMLLENDYDCYLNYAFGPYNLDCALFIGDIKIDIEYDGWYWHKDEESEKSDNRRNGYMYNNDFKVLRIKGGRNIPSLNDLIEGINFLKKDGNKYYEIILPEWGKK